MKPDYVAFGKGLDGKWFLIACGADRASVAELYEDYGPSEVVQKVFCQVIVEFSF